MTRKRKNKSGLGRALIKSKETGRSENQRFANLHIVDEEKRGKTRFESVTEVSDLSEFVEKIHHSVLARGGEEGQDTDGVVIVKSPEIETAVSYFTPEEQETVFLPIPRKPLIMDGLSKEEYQELERESFYEWRRNIEKLRTEKKLILSPFEKNLNIWRELWRVVERSDVVCQIVDSRNPNFFLSKDMINLVTSLKATKKGRSGMKLNFIILTKSNMFDPIFEDAWSKYFEDLGLPFAFMRSDTPENAERLILDISRAWETFSATQVDDKGNPIVRNYTIDPLTLGFVGYPNVGKSTLLNALASLNRKNLTSLPEEEKNALFSERKSKKIMHKKIFSSISATPGKTKHLQSVVLRLEYLQESIPEWKHHIVNINDCPGLVLPSIMSSRADMVVNGILSIDTLRDYRSAIQTLCAAVPGLCFAEKYTLRLKISEETRRCTADELLDVFGLTRGFVKVNGMSDHSKCARFLLKDFVSGRMPFVNPPPHCEKYCSFDWDEQIIAMVDRRVKEEGKSVVVLEKVKRDVIAQEKCERETVDDERKELWKQMSHVKAGVKGRKQDPTARPPMPSRHVDVEADDEEDSEDEQDSVEEDSEQDDI